MIDTRKFFIFFILQVDVLFVMETMLSTTTLNLYKVQTRFIFITHFQNFKVILNHNSDFK